MRHYAFSELGQRANNEDFLAFDDQGVFIVCDGVGGNEKGEVASKIVAESFLKALAGGGDFNLALSMAQEGVDHWIEEHPESQGMATTLTVLQLKEGRVHVAWCGDSRIYQFRSGEIIRRTVDHSWVNDAVKAGIITQEEANGHPKSNVITRAIQGSHRPVRLEIEDWGEIELGDVFMLCSDGVLACWADEELECVVSGSSLPEAVATIQKRCAEAANDNATAIFVQVDQHTNGVGGPERVLGIHPKLLASVLLLVVAALLVWLIWPKAEEHEVETIEWANPVMEAINATDVEELSEADEGIQPSTSSSLMTGKGVSD